MNYEDSATGIAIITTYFGEEIDRVPCYIRYGNHPSKGGYGMCLVLDVSPYNKYGDDKFGIIKITPQDNTVLCELFGSIRRNEDRFGTNKVVVEVRAGWSRLMSSVSMSRLMSSVFITNLDYQESDSNQQEERISEESDESVESEDIESRKHWWKFW